MILAVPILIAVAFFMGWVLVKLTIHALPLFAGVSGALYVHHSGGSLETAAVAGGLAALAVFMLGRLFFERTRSPTTRLLVGLAFTAPAAFAAWHAALGLAAPVLSSGVSRGAVAMIAAFLVGSAAWRGLASHRDAPQHG